MHAGVVEARIAGRMVPMRAVAALGGKPLLLVGTTSVVVEDSPRSLFQIPDGCTIRSEEND